MNQNLNDLLKVEVLNKQVKKIINSSNLEYIPEVAECNNVTGEVRNRFCVNGLIDNVILKVNRNSANLLGIWFAGISLQANFSIYRLQLVDSIAGITDIFCEVGNKSRESKKVSFDWNFEEPSDFINKLALSNDEKLHFSVTNYDNNWITMDDFYQRNVILFGGIQVTTRMATLLLNIGGSSSTGYITLKHLENKNQIGIADSDSCEFRIEVE